MWILILFYCSGGCHPAVMPTTYSTETACDFVGKRERARANASTHKCINIDPTGARP